MPEGIEFSADLHGYENRWSEPLYHLLLAGAWLGALAPIAQRPPRHLRSVAHSPRSCAFRSHSRSKFTQETTQSCPLRKESVVAGLSRLSRPHSVGKTRSFFVFFVLKCPIHKEFVVAGVYYPSFLFIFLIYYTILCY